MLGQFSVFLCLRAVANESENRKDDTGLVSKVSVEKGNIIQMKCILPGMGEREREREAEEK